MGLSQQQLAGAEMTRVFISLVEAGKCNPSPDNLQVIAQRLGKPVEYFLGETTDVDRQLAVVTALLQSAEQDLVIGQEPEQIISAQRRVQEALKGAVSLQRKDLEARAHIVQARCFWYTDKLAEALEEYERALACFEAVQDRAKIAATHKEMGDLHFRREEYDQALAAYRRGVPFTTDNPALTPLRSDALTFMGSTCYRLGQYDESSRYYRAALEIISQGQDPSRWGNAALGLGWTEFVRGELGEALVWTEAAAAAYAAQSNSNLVLAKHNLAIIEGARGNQAGAFTSLNDCLELYRQQGRIDKQAATLEEIALCWYHQGEFDKAEKACWEALDLLDIQDNTALSGRLYRLLALVAERMGHLRQSYTFLRVSYDLLRDIKAHQEAQRTLVELDRIRSYLTTARAANSST